MGARMIWGRWRGVALCLAALAAASASAQGQEEACRAPAWSVEGIQAQPRIDRTMSAKELRAYSDKFAAHPAGPGTMAGLYEPQAKVAADIDWGSQSVSSSQASICVRAIAYQSRLEPVIHIASEIPEGSCADDVAIAHEMRHHADAVALYPKGIVVFAGKAPWPTAPFVGSDLLDAKKVAGQYAADYMTRMGPVQGELFHARYQEVDTPEEYFRVGQQCGPSGIDGIMERAAK